VLEDCGTNKAAASLWRLHPVRNVTLGTADPSWLAVGFAVSHAGVEHVVSVVHGQKGKSLDDHSAACFNRRAPKPGDFPESTDPEPRHKPEALPNPAGDRGPS